MLRPSAFSIRPAAIALVGLPTSVPSPPSEAAKAMPIITAPAKPPVSPSCTPPARTTARAIGIMISVVEVLEMNHLSSAVYVQQDWKSLVQGKRGYGRVGSGGSR